MAKAKTSKGRVRIRQLDRIVQLYHWDGEIIKHTVECFLHWARIRGLWRNGQK